ncbi:helicase associated domain-containing protein [Microbacterium aquimaris]|uniref:helicase associated domain-containing protein n=1 Tax=Microbacterium aquimaris TaxID=459816 RepID=UPI0039064262
MPTPTTPEALHSLADALWRTTAPDDIDAVHYARTAALVVAGNPRVPRRAARWLVALHRYEAHWSRVGRAPRENTRARDTLGDDERRLGEWARYQRRFEERLNAYQRARLDVSPAFEWDPLERAWRTQYAACVRFVVETGNLPRLHATDPAEFRLARWLGRQLRRLQTGKLERTRAKDLNRLLSGGAPPSA